MIAVLSRAQEAMMLRRWASWRKELVLSARRVLGQSEDKVGRRGMLKDAGPGWVAGALRRVCARGAGAVRARGEAGQRRLDRGQGLTYKFLGWAHE